MTTALTLARENRIMLEAVKTDITEIKASIKLISNHYSKRLPLWEIAFMGVYPFYYFWFFDNRAYSWEC